MEEKPKVLLNLVAYEGFSLRVMSSIQQVLGVISINNPITAIEIKVSTARVYQYHHLESIQENINILGKDMPSQFEQLVSKHSTQQEYNHQ